MDLSIQRQALYQLSHKRVVQRFGAVAAGMVMAIAKICRVGDHDRRQLVVPKRCMVTQTRIGKEPAIEPHKQRFNGQGWIAVHRSENLLAEFAGGTIADDGDKIAGLRVFQIPTAI